MKRFITLVAPCVLLMGLGLDLYIPAEHMIMQSLGLEFHQIQWTLTIYMYMFGVGQLVMGPISDALGRHKALVFSILFYFLGSVMIILTSDYQAILLGRALQAFGACGAMVCALALCRDTYDGAKALRAFTYIRGIGTLAPILAPSIGVILAIKFGWRADFYFLALFSIFALVGSFFIQYPKSNKKRNDQSIVKHFAEIIIHPTFIKYSFCAAMIQAAMFGYFSSSAVIYLTLLKSSESLFAVLFSLNAAAFMVVAFGFANRMSTMGIDKSIRIGAYLIMLAGLLTGVLHFTIGFTIVTMFIPCLIASSGCAFGLGASCTGAMAPFKDQSGKAAALLGCIEFIFGGLLGSLLVSYPIQHTLPIGIFYILLAIAIHMALLKQAHFKLSKAS